MRSLAVVLFALALVGSRAAFAADAEQAGSTMDFEGEVVEGVKQPKDTDAEEGEVVQGARRPISTTRLPEPEAIKARAHVYRKPTSFQPQNRELVHELLETY